jgi:hypothetical protein
LALTQVDQTEVTGILLCLMTATRPERTAQNNEKGSPCWKVSETTNFWLLRRPSATAAEQFLSSGGAETMK